MLALALTNVGCRQTTGPTAGGPLTPVGPMSPVGLSPVPTGAARTTSAISPLGAPTRVPPPPNNSFQGQGAAPASFVPYGQANVAPYHPSNANAPYDSFSTVPNPAAAANALAAGNASYGNAAIGSSVVTSGWNETGAQVSTVSGTEPIPRDAGGAPQFQQPPFQQPQSQQPSASPRVRFNGMQVNDLTGAPSTAYNSNASVVPYAAPQTAATLSRGYYPPAVDPRNPISLMPTRAAGEHPSYPQYDPQPMPNPAVPQSLAAMVPAERVTGAGANNLRPMVSGQNIATEGSANASLAATSPVNAFESRSNLAAEHGPYSPTAPAFQGAQRFNSSLPSTEPIGESATQTATNDNLRWGRPRTSF